MDNTNINLILFIVFGVVIAALIIYYKFFKIPKIGSLCMVTGGVKTGKSTLSVFLAIKHHKKAVRITKIKNYFFRLFGLKSKIREIPLLYSNIPLNYDYVPLTKDLLLRKSRFVYGSIIYICEASLVADSQLIKDQDVNVLLLLFNKLIGHETHGGKLIYDTQSISDVHYSIKRSLSEYFYIHHLRKGLFFLYAYLIENRYSDDGSVIAVNTGDVENDLVRVIIPKRYWKYFDCYCYSVFTDKLPVENTVCKGVRKRLKAKNILTFRSKINEYVGDNQNEKNYD